MVRAILKMFPSSRYRFIGALVLISLVLVQSGRADSNDSSMFDSMDRFEINAELEIRSKDGLVGTVKTREFYWTTRNRAKIIIDAPWIKDGPIEYYYLYFYREFVRYSRNPNTPADKACFTGDEATLTKDLFGPSLTQKLHEFYDDILLPGHLIGYARFMHYILSLRNYLTNTGNTRVRSHHVTSYLFNKFRWGQANVYIGSQGDESELYTGDFPLRLNFSNENDHHFDLNYFSLAPIVNNHMTDIGDLVDEFTPPLGKHCTPNSPYRDDDLYYEPIHKRRVVSFEMELTRFHYNSIGALKGELIGHKYVAYDDFSLKHREDSLDPRGSEGYGNVISIYDGALGSLYTIRMDAKRERNVEQNLNSNKHQCYSVTRIKDQVRFMPIIPLTNLKEMGLAQVRGTWTRVFEHQVDQLPPLFFSPTLYMDPDRKDDYTINYFITSLETPPVGGHEQIDLDKLLRIDVYQLDRLVWRGEIHNFIWQLADAPNGDKSDELFSFQHRCLSSGLVGQHPPTENPTKVSLELVYEADKTNKTRAQQDLEIELLRASAIRNRAIMRMIHAHDASSLNVHKLRSHVYTEDQTVRLFVSLMRATIMPPKFLLKHHPIKYVNLDNYEPRHRARTNEECYWEAVRFYYDQRRPVDYMFCDSKCYIDVRQSVESGKPQQNGDMELFAGGATRSSETQCRVLNIMPITGPAMNNPDTQMRMSHWLREKELELDLVDSDVRSSANPTVVSVKLARYESRNQKWFNSTEEEDNHLIEADAGYDRLEGLSLTDKSGKLVQLDLDSESDSSQMDVRTCNAICQADADCRSYSVCVRDQIECRLSSLEFKDQKLLKLIEKKKSEVKSSSKKPISVDYPRDSNTTTKDADQVELRVDFRCHIYNKHYMDLFHEIIVEVHSYHRGHTYFVANEEECAEICFNTNLKFPSQLANRQQQVAKRETLAASMKYSCTGFSYHSLSDPTPDSMVGFARNQRSDVQGFCWLDPSTTPTEDSATILDGIKGYFLASTDTYRLNFHRFFKRQQDVRLRGDMTGELQSSSEPNDATGAKVNRQIVMRNPDVEHCARQCITQEFDDNSMVCRSFDIVTEKGNSSQPDRLSCIFNSITLTEALKDHPELVVKSEASAAKESTVQFRHYELQSAFALTRVLMGESHIVLIDPNEAPTEQAATSRGLFGHLFVLLCAIATGSCIIIALDRYYGPRIWTMFATRNSNQDTLNSFLVVEDSIGTADLKA